MTPTETKLWERITSFPLDETGAQFTFSARLARENGWSTSYTFRVIEEYRRFIFLCCTSPTPVTPSDPVDQAWHLHLTYTKSYWHDLCRDTLKKEIHHNPTKGGTAERQKFNGLYTGLKKIYAATFGSPPPSDIWHNNKSRFAEVNFQRVSLHRYWLIKKPSFTVRKFASALVFLTFMLLFIQSSGEGFGIFILILFVFALISAYNKHNNNNGDGNGGGGCSTFSCSGDSHHSGCSSHGSDSGCSSHGCSSGCSGCGGCGGGGD